MSEWFAAMLLAATPANTTPVLELPEWLSGAWVSRDTDGGWTEEWWTSPRAGIMLGASRSGKADRLGFFEHMRIARNSAGLEFCALPQGRAGTCFPAVSASSSEIAFENASHDYPKRIVYRREKFGISAEISGAGGSRRQVWQLIPLA